MMRACALVLLAACGDDFAPTDLGVDLAAPVADLGADLASGLVCATPPSCVCPTPAPGHVCVHGSLFDFVTNTEMRPPGFIEVAAYDPLQFVSNSMPVKLGCATPQVAGAGCWMLADLTLPPSGMLTLTAGDQSWVPAGMRDYVPTATLIQASGGATIHADLYLVTRALLGSWMSTANLDFVDNGTAIFQFFDAPAPAANELPLGDTRYAAGVAVDGARYLTKRDFVGASSLAATQAGVGLAIMVAPPGVPSIGGNVDGGPACGQWRIVTAIPGFVYVDNSYCR